MPAHIGIAPVHGMGFLLTWNCAHIANAFVAKAVAHKERDVFKISSDYA
jgi:hypothetical protein